MTQDERDSLLVAVGRLDRRVQGLQKDLELVKGILVSTGSDDAATSATQEQDTTNEQPAQAKSKKDLKLRIRDPAIQELVDQHKAAKEAQRKQREEESQEEQGVKPRVAPYAVIITSVTQGPKGPHVTVKDVKYSETTMIPVDERQAAAIKAAIEKGQTLQFEMNEKELKDAEWLPSTPEQG